MNDEDQSNDLLRSLQATLAMHAASAPPPPTATIADVMAPKQPREPASKKKAPPRSVGGDSMDVLHARAEGRPRAVTPEIIVTEEIIESVAACIAHGLNPTAVHVLPARAKEAPVEAVESEAIVPRRDEPTAPVAPVAPVAVTAALTVTQAHRHDVLSILMECIGRGLTPAQAEEFMVLAAKFSKT